MTFTELLAELYEDLGYQTAPAAAVITRAKRRLNQAHAAVLSEPGLASLLNGVITFAAVANQARYGLSNVAEIRGITTATNDRQLYRRSEAWYRATNPDPAANTGTPDFFIPIGHVAVAQVSAETGTGLWVVSSSAADTAGPTATLDAVRVGGYPNSPTAVALNGVTRVAVGALTDYIDVTQFQLSAACAGDISLYDAAAAGNLLAVIPRGQTSSRYFGFYLTRTPSTAETFTLSAELEVQPLVNDTDEPRLPHKFHRILGMRARMREYEGKDDGRFKIAAAEYQETLIKLKAHVNGAGDPLIPGGNLRGRSDLGPNYPAGTIWS
jgi:hypothetical protein